MKNKDREDVLDTMPEWRISPKKGGGGDISKSSGEHEWELTGN